MSVRSLAGLGVLVLSLAAGSASAATVWNNGAPSVTNVGGNQLTDTIEADDFTLSSTTDLTGVRFWSIEYTALDFSGSIFWQILSNVGNSPGSVLGSGTVSGGALTRSNSTAITVGGGGPSATQVQNDFTISVTGLAAGTYWLALHNGPLSNTGTTDFYWSWTDANATNAGTNAGQGKEIDISGQSYATNDSEAAFLISGTAAAGVPEPGAMLLTLAGLSALAFVRRRS